MISNLHIALLGSFRVTLNDQPVTDFATDKVRALLAYLAVEAGIPHRRSALATLLWPDHPEAAARQNLRQTLLRLRQSLPEQTLDATNTSVQLNPDAAFSVDVRLFLDAIEGTKTHAHDALTTCPICQGRLAEAVRLYSGDFLEQFYVADSNEFEDWARLHRERLHAEALQALDALSESALIAGRHDQARQFALRQVALDPLRESAYHQLMRIAALQDRRAEALALYNDWVRIAERELGLEPDEETSALAEAIRSGTFTVPQHERRIATNLPVSVTPFIGRKHELEQIDSLLQQPHPRLITLLGPGGIGKTRLAIEAARANLTAFPYGVYFVPLVGYDSAGSLIYAIAEAVGLSLYEDVSPIQQITDYVRRKEMLLLVDNAEHLVESQPDATNQAALSEIVYDLLEAAPRLKVLATSRARLSVQGEQLIPLDGLAYLQPDDADPRSQSDAVTLFVSAAKRVRPEIAITDEDAEAVSWVCRYVQGMPLAILLTSAWVEVLSPREIQQGLQAEQELGNLPDLLAYDTPDLPDRQRSLQRVFETSWKLLSEGEQDVFQRLSILRGGFDRHAALEIAGVSLRDLSFLLSRSLIRQDAAGRYSIHEMLRQFAFEKLAADQDVLQETWEACAAFYFRMLAEEHETLKRSGQPALARIDTDFDNIVGAWKWAIQTCDRELLSQGLPGLTLFCEWRSRHQDGDALTSGALQCLEGAADAALLAARLWASRSVFLRLQGDAMSAAQALQRCEETLHDAPDGDEAAAIRAMVALQRGHAALGADDLPTAAHRYQESLDQYQALHDEWGGVQAMAGLGEVAFRGGAYHEARQWLETSLAAARSIESQRSIAHALEALSYVLRDLGDMPGAAQVTAESIALYEELGDPAKIAASLLAQGWLSIYMGEFEAAIAPLEKSIALHDDLGLLPPVSVLGIALLELGMYARASTLLNPHIERCRYEEEARELGQCLNELGAIAAVEGRFDEARQLLLETEEIQRDAGFHDRLATARAMLAYAERGAGRPAEAWGYCQQALEFSVESRAFVQMTFALPAAALLLADEGQVELAARLYLPLMNLPLTANSTLRTDLFGRELAAMLADLPDAVRAEAGAPADLWQIAEEAAIIARQHSAD